MHFKEAFFIVKLNKKLLAKAVVFLLSMIISLSGLFSVYAANFDYFNESRWDNNKNVISAKLNKTSTVNHLSGAYKYFVDESDSCLYTAFFINETTLNVKKDDVRIKYSLYDGITDCEFAVNKNGIADALRDPVCDVYQNFSTYEDYKYTGVYICILDFDKVKYSTDVQISLSINGHIYFDVVTINIPPTKPTTTKAQKTQTVKWKSTQTKSKNDNVKSKSSKNTSERSTKFYAGGTVQSKTQQSRNSNSKYSYQNSYSQQEEVTTAAYYDAQSQNAQSENTEQTYSPTGKLTQQSKNMIIIAAVIAFVGLCFLIASAFTSSDKNDEGKKENSDDIEKSDE